VHFRLINAADDCIAFIVIQLLADVQHCGDFDKKANCGKSQEKWEQ
jgi:hypothetical protein